MTINGSNSTKLHTPYLMTYQLTGCTDFYDNETLEMKACHSFASSVAKAVDVKYFQFFDSGRVRYSVLMRADSWHDLKINYQQDFWASGCWLNGIGESVMLNWEFPRAELNFWIPNGNNSSTAGQAKVTPGAKLQSAINVLPAKSADFTIKLHKVSNLAWGNRLRALLWVIGFAHMYNPNLVMFKCESFHQSGHVPFRVQALPFNGFV